MKSFRDIFRPRKAPGTPEGGRFAAKTQSEPQINLGPQMGAASRDGDITEEDGTYWVYAGDHYRDWYTSSTDKIKLEVSTFDETGITQLVVVDGRSPGYKELAVQEFEGDYAVEKAMAHGKAVRESALEQGHNQMAGDEASLSVVRLPVTAI